MDVTILIVEYRCIEQVATCIASLRQWLGALEWECVVVSNSKYSESENNKYRDELACDQLPTELTSGRDGCVAIVLTRQPLTAVRGLPGP